MNGQTINYRQVLYLETQQRERRSCARVRPSFYSTICIRSHYEEAIHLCFGWFHYRHPTSLVERQQIVAPFKTTPYL